MKNEKYIIEQLAIVERQLKEATSSIAKETLERKKKRLNAELKGVHEPSDKIAEKLLAERNMVKSLSKTDFNDLIKRLSKLPEYGFLKTMPKHQIRTDIERKAKPVGARFKGRGNYKTPTPTQIKSGLKNGTVYIERRPLRSDVSKIARLSRGGSVKDYASLIEVLAKYCRFKYNSDLVESSVLVYTEDKGSINEVKKVAFELENGKSKEVDVQDIFVAKYKFGGNVGDHIVFNRHDEERSGEITEVLDDERGYEVHSKGAMVLVDDEDDIISITSPKRRKKGGNIASSVEKKDEIQPESVVIYDENKEAIVKVVFGDFAVLKDQNGQALGSVKLDTLKLKANPPKKMYAGQKKVANDIDRKLKAEQSRSNSNEKRRKLQSEMFHEKLRRKSNLKK